MAAPIGPGDFVECVDAAPRGAIPTGLRERAIYSVRRCLVCPPGYADAGEPLVVLNELSAPSHGFYADRFRPIYRPKADFIESLKAPPISAPQRITEAA